MLQRQERLLNAIVLFFILAGIVFTYLPEIHNGHYRIDDYLFLSQVTQHGLAKSLLIPWRNHFLPLYRLLMGGLHLVFENAVPLRLAIVGFHLINTYLIFRIVRAQTESVILSAIGSATFCFAFPAVHCIDNCINGHWVTSLTFILLMSIYFEKFFTSCVNSGNEGTDDHTSACRACFPPSKYFYLGLLSFTIGLGFFTTAFFGGVVIWLFLLARLSFKEGIKGILQNHARIMLAFFSIALIYLILRTYLNDRYFPLQDTTFQGGSLKPPLPSEEKMLVIKGLWPEFYLYAARLLVPYFPQHYPWVYMFLSALMAKELLYRRKQATFAAAWLVFGLLTLALTAFGRIFYVLGLLGNVHYALAPWYFYYPAAGVSIALGLLLRLPPSLEKIAAKSSKGMCVALLGMTLALLTVFNYNNMRTARNVIDGWMKEDLKFSRLVTQYRDSMTSFLGSPDYSSDGEYYFVDSLAAPAPEYRSGWFVMQHNLFQFYFPRFRNISFVGEQQEKPDMYLWTPQAVSRR
ncbi:hypothetical protein HZA56_08045 [Candidatus Poribacteria bacterium]|nr:hypothetical protein [Candidatus Poribacteria bacterium]